MQDLILESFMVVIKKSTSQRLIYVIIFIIIGIALLVSVFAAGEQYTFEAENTESEVMVETDDTASNNAFIQFENIGAPPIEEYPDPLWHADADSDEIIDQPTTSSVGETRYWRRMEQSNLLGRLNIIDDPLGLYGKVYEARLSPEDLAADLKRAEWSQMTGSDGEKIRLYENGITNVYFGWRANFGLPDNIAITGSDNDGNYMQIKGDSSCGGPAVGLTIRNERLSIRSIDGDYIAMDGPLLTSLLDNQWHDIVFNFNFAKDNSGYVSMWIDGEPQIMNNGQTRINLPTVCPNDTYVYPKLGVYSMDIGIGTGPRHLIESPRIGESYESVVPR